MIFAYLGFTEEKTRDICLNGRFLKRKHDIFAKMGDFRRENTGLSLKWGIFKDKMHDFRLNARFLKRKRLIFA